MISLNAHVGLTSGPNVSTHNIYFNLIISVDFVNDNFEMFDDKNKMILIDTI